MQTIFARRAPHVRASVRHAPKPTGEGSRWMHVSRDREPQRERHFSFAPPPSNPAWGGHRSLLPRSHPSATASFTADGTNIWAATSLCREYSEDNPTRDSVRELWRTKRSCASLCTLV